MAKKISRRNMLKFLGAGAAGAALAACQPKTVLVEVEKVVKETVVVEQEKVVKETVIVEGTPQVVEKVVKETVVIEVEKEPPVSALGGQVTWETWRGPGTGWNEERMESFQEMHPEVEFEFLPMPWGDYAKMYAEAAAGDLGDLISFDPGHLVFGAAIENGLLLPWDELVAADPTFDRDEWFDQFVQEWGDANGVDLQAKAIPNAQHPRLQIVREPPSARAPTAATAQPPSPTGSPTRGSV